MSTILPTLVSLNALALVVGISIITVIILVTMIAAHRNTIRKLHRQQLLLIDECAGLKKKMEHARAALGKANVRIGALEAGYEFLGEQQIALRAIKNDTDSANRFEAVRITPYKEHNFTLKRMGITGTGFDIVTKAMEHQIQEERALAS